MLLHYAARRGALPRLLIKGEGEDRVTTRPRAPTPYPSAFPPFRRNIRGGMHPLTRVRPLFLARVIRQQLVALSSSASTDHPFRSSFLLPSSVIGSTRASSSRGRTRSDRHREIISQTVFVCSSIRLFVRALKSDYASFNRHVQLYDPRKVLEDPKMHEL